MRVVFGIITNGLRPDKLQATLDSIWTQRIDITNLEVVVAGDVERARNIAHLEAGLLIEEREAAEAGLLGVMRNAIADAILRRYPLPDVCVFADDDILFKLDFCRQIAEFKDDWDLMCPRIENPDGTRYWDWATVGGPKGHRLLDYGETDEFWYNTGGLMVCKPAVIQKVRWPAVPINNHLKGGQNEDLLFSRVVQDEEFRVKVNPRALAVHDAPLTSRRRRFIVTVESADREEGVDHGQSNG